MIALTIPQAAERVHRTPEVIRRWIRAGRLTATHEPITGLRYVWEADLLAAERAARAAIRAHQFKAAS